MHLRSSSVAAILVSCLGTVVLASAADSQTIADAPLVLASASLPDAPVPQSEPAQTTQATQDSAATTTPQSSSSQNAQPATRGTPDPKQDQHQTAEEQLKAEEHQRVLGIVPNFGTSYVSDAATLSPGQKMQLAFRSAIDPVTFATAFVVAGLHEGLKDDTGFGWGPEGYFKRSGAAYLDAFDGDIIGNGILPVLFHQDPRYFRLGHGTIHHRLFYAIATSYIAKHDNTGRWEPNYSNVIGNIASGAISNLYYPSEDSGWGQTITNGLIVTTEGTFGGIFDEFWPDISRKVLHKDPTHGLDAQKADAAKQ